MYIYYILLTHQNLQKKINTDFLNTFSYLNKKIEYLFIKQYQKVINRRAVSEKTYCFAIKPRKGKDIKWILIENIYSLFRELMKRLYMFSISIHLISLPFRGFNCEAVAILGPNF